MLHRVKAAFLGASFLASGLACPALAQQSDTAEERPAGPPQSVFDGDYLTVGVGAGYVPSYSGSDSYNLQILPIVQGSLGGVDINPRPAGLALDFVPDPDDGIAFSAGPMIRLRSDRDDAEDINDDIVAAYGELERAVEVGASVGIKFPKQLNPFDSVSINLDAAWDVAGAHGGMYWSPSVTYFTPLSFSTAASLTLSATFVDDDFADYYYTVPPTNSLLPDEDLLPGFAAKGGMQSYGLNLFVAHDLSGNVLDGGLSVVGIGGWSKLTGDAKDTPFTALRGNDDQFFVALGLGYTF